MTKDVTFLHFYDRAVQKMEVTAAHRAAGNLENYIAVFDDLRLWAVNYLCQ
jgi:hypothetical protein